MKISFVVPTYNNERTIQACLASLRQQTHPDIEIVVVDNSSSDRTCSIAVLLADIVAQQGPERCAQRNHGTLLSTGEIVVFIDSDMVLEPGVATAIVSAFVAEPHLGALVIPEHSFGEGFWASCKVLEKSLYVGDSSVEAPRAFRRDVIESVGGWDETLTAAEDWDLRDRTRAAGVHVGRIDSFIWHDEGKLRMHGTYGKKRYYGRWVGEYFSRTGSGSSHLARTSLFSHPTRLARHPVLTTGMLTMKSVEAAGLFAGMRDARKLAQASASAHNESTTRSAA